MGTGGCGKYKFRSGKWHFMSYREGREKYNRAKYNNPKPCRDSKGKKDYDSRYTVFDESVEDNMFTNNGISTGGGNTMRKITAAGANSEGAATAVPVGEKTPTVSFTGGTGQSTYKYYLSYRRELLWAANCTAGSMEDLSKNLKPVQKLQGHQQTLTVLNGIFGLFILGIVFPITVIMFIFDKDSDLPCIPGSGEVEEKNIKKAKSVCGFIAKISKWIPLILAVQASGGVKTFFATVGKAQCSDPETNEVFAYLGTTIGKVDEANQRTLVADILMLIATILTALYSMYKDHKKKRAVGAYQ